MSLSSRAPSPPRGTAAALIRRLLAYPREHPLGWRLLGALVAASSALAIAATAVLLVLDYRREVGAIDDAMARMERSQLPSIANSLWAFDATQLQLQLDGLLHMQGVKHAVLTAKGGERFEAGIARTNQVLTRTFVVRHAADDAVLGSLQLTVALDDLIQDMASKALLILAATVTGTLLVALVMTWLVQRWVTRHLQHMARFARSLRLDQLGGPLVLARRPGAAPDELDDVAGALNEMMFALAEELVRRATINADRARLFSANERNRALLQSIIDNSAAAISVKALDGRYLLVNRQCAQRHHRSAQAFIGKTDHDLFPPALAERLRRLDQRVIASGAALQEEEEIPLDEGTCTVLSAKAPIFNGNGEVYAVCGIHTDISDRKRAEKELAHYREHLEVLVAQRTAELQQAQTQLVQSEKMASIGALAAGVAHEINNPIGFVSANLGTLSQYVSELLGLVAAYEVQDEAIGRHAPQALEAIRQRKHAMDLAFLREDVTELGRETADGLARVTRIVQDLKDFSHAGESQWQVCDVHKGLDSTLNIAWNELKYKVDVIKHYGDVPEIECLPSELNQVFMNLFVNAAQAIRTRGQLNLSTGQCPGGVWIEVADTGSGIAPEHLPRVFEPFFTTKPVGQGTGLGLALSYAIVRKHHGRIEVRSTLGAGTTFRIWLPCSQARESTGIADDANESSNFAQVATP